jgi:hypothetical protein
MYRASADDDEMAAAVANVGQALLLAGDEQARTEVDSAAHDGMTASYALDRLQQIVSVDRTHNAAGDRNARQ